MESRFIVILGFNLNCDACGKSFKGAKSKGFINDRGIFFVVCPVCGHIQEGGIRFFEDKGNG